MSNFLALAERLDMIAHWFRLEPRRKESDVCEQAAQALREAHAELNHEVHCAAGVDPCCPCLAATQLAAQRAEAEVARLRALLREARAEVEFWTPDECHVSEGELHYLNLWFELRDRIDAELKDKP